MKPQKSWKTVDNLKFRAWDIEHKRMIYWDEILHDRFLLESFFGNEQWLTNPPKPFFKRMQCTGLLDKKKKDIYAGDCLGGLFSSVHIDWCDTCVSLTPWIPDLCLTCEGDMHWYELVEENGKLEVLGNIYQNPELLTGQ